VRRYWRRRQRRGQAQSAPHGTGVELGGWTLPLLGRIHGCEEFLEQCHEGPCRPGPLTKLDVRPRESTWQTSRASKRRSQR
jgi:hypothetical protein